MAASLGPSIVEAGLVLSLDAADKMSYKGSGTVWKDLSGTNNGILTNGPTFSGVNGGTIVFDGTDDYVAVSDNSLLDIDGDKTLACWVNLGSDSGGTCIVGKVSNSALGMALAYSWDSKGFQAIAWNSTNSPQLDKDLNRDINKWVYIVAVQSSTTRWIYALDSIGLRSASGTGGINSWNNNVSFTIGSTSEGYYVPANTKISNVLVYNRALSAAEVLQNYNANKERFGL